MLDWLGAGERGTQSTPTFLAQAVWDQGTCTRGNLSARCSPALASVLPSHAQELLFETKEERV